MPPAIRLLATDLDGTLIGGAQELPKYADFHERMEDLRDRFGTVWVACTGRTLESFSAFFSPMRRLGIVPDYVIIRHIYLFRRVRWGFVPHVSWNLLALYRMWREVVRSGEVMKRWHEEVTETALGSRTIRRERLRLCVRFDSEEAAAAAAEVLRRHARDHEHLQVIAYLREVDVRFVPATKGHAVNELAHHLKIRPENILAIGNGHNDLSMLTPSVAGMTGCPSNSDAEVIQAVHRHRGHVAKERALSGVLEIIDAHTHGAVSSRLPRNWAASTPKREFSNAKRKRQSRSPSRASPWMLLVILYIGLLAFAHFDILPFSHLIRRPVEFVISLLTSLMEWAKL